MAANFDILYLNPNYVVLATRKEVKSFAEAHTNLLGNTFIIVHGECRLVKWKSVGAGLYKVFTTEWE